MPGKKKSAATNSSLNFATFVFVNHDGIGDLQHWIDYDAFLVKRYGRNYRPLRIVVCDNKRLEECKEKLLEHNYQVSTDSANILTSTMIIPINFFETVMSMWTTALGTGKKPQATTLSIVQSHFTQFCKTINRNLLTGIKYFSFVSTIPFGMREIENYHINGGDTTGKTIHTSFDLKTLRRDFPNTKWLAIGEHGCANLVPPEVPILRMGFGKQNHGIKFKSIPLTSVKETLEVLENKTLRMFLQITRIEDESTLFVPMYMKDPETIYTVIQSILASPLVTQKTTVIFYLSGCSEFTFDKYNATKKQLDCDSKHNLQFVSPTTKINLQAKVYIFNHWKVSSKDYAHLQQLGAMRGSIGGCAGDNTFERLSSLDMFPLYHVPSTEKVNTLRELQLLYPELNDIFEHFINSSNIAKRKPDDMKEKQQCFKLCVTQISKSLNVEMIATWKNVTNDLRLKQNFYTNLIKFLKEKAPELISEDTFFHILQVHDLCFFRKATKSIILEYAQEDDVKLEMPPMSNSNQPAKA